MLATFEENLFLNDYFRILKLSLLLNLPMF